MKLKSIKSSRSGNGKSLAYKVEILKNVNDGMKAVDAIEAAAKTHKKELTPSATKFPGSIVFSAKKSVESALEAGNEEVEKLVEAAGLNEAEEAEDQDDDSADDSADEVQDTIDDALEASEEAEKIG